MTENEIINLINTYIEQLREFQCKLLQINEGAMAEMTKIRIETLMSLKNRIAEKKEETSP